MIFVSRERLEFLDALPVSLRARAVRSRLCRALSRCRRARRSLGDGVPSRLCRALSRCRRARRSLGDGVPSRLCRALSRCRRARSLGDGSHAVAREFIGNVGLDRRCGGNVGVAALDVALPQLDYAAAIEGTRMFRGDLERRVVVDDRIGELTKLEIGKAAAGECIGIIAG